MTFYPVRSRKDIGSDCDRTDGVFVGISCPVDGRTFTIKLSTRSGNLATFLCLLRAFGKTTEAWKSKPCITCRSQKSAMRVVDAKFCFCLWLFACYCFEPRKCLAKLGETQTNLCTEEEVHSWTWPFDRSIWNLFWFVGRGDAAYNERNFWWVFMIKNLRSIAVHYRALGYLKKKKKRKIRQNYGKN